ncbi:hypothetical protein [Streptomyces parvus]|uniref:hypothetical protein n=1 Tax=Streptomyces parvus TaxID=66428 RepID=UPI0036BB0F87
MERNADEFLRIRNMLVEADEPAERAEKKTHWHSEGSRRYEARVAEARKLVVNLAEGYGKAASALRSYAFALTTAKSHYSNGKANEQALATLIATKGTAITRKAQDAEPMRQWEDMRGTTGVLDFFAELTMDVDDIKDEANRLHDAAGGDFHLARTVEKEARDICVHAMKQAYDLLPEFRLRDVPRVDIYSAISALRSEAREARDNPLTQLPGSGPKQDYAAPVGSAPVSPMLRDIRMQLADLPPGEGRLLDSPVLGPGEAGVDRGEQGDHPSRGEQIRAARGHGRGHRVAGDRGPAGVRGRCGRHDSGAGRRPLGAEPHLAGEPAVASRRQS